MGERKLPKGWEWKRLGDVAKIITKGATPTSYGFAFQETGIKFVKIENIKNNQISESSIKQFISPEANENQKRSILEEGDILFSIAGTIGNSCLVQKKDLPSNVNQAIAIIRGTSEIFDPFFLLHFLKSKIALDQLIKKTRGVALNNVSLGDVRDLQIITPPLPVQCHIVAFIEQAEAVKRHRKVADEWTGALLQSVFLEMFGNPENNSKKWELVKLGDVSKVVVSYVGPINQYFCEKEEGVPLLNTTNIKPDGLISNDFRYVSREFHKKNKKSQLHPGDIIVARHGKSGSATIIPDLLLEAQSINNVIIKRSTELEPDYVRHLFNLSTHSQKMLGLKTGTVQKIINTKQLADFKIPLPPLALQQQFAQIVENVERIRERQVASGRQIEGLCEGLMARAFRGELVA
jgi:restriction endonuclease S subunit